MTMSDHPTKTNSISLEQRISNSLRKRFSISPFSGVVVRYHHANYFLPFVESLFVFVKMKRNRQLIANGLRFDESKKRYVPNGKLYSLDARKVRINSRNKRRIVFAFEQPYFASAILRIREERLKREPDWLRVKCELVSVAFPKQYLIRYSPRLLVLKILELEKREHIQLSWRLLIPKKRKGKSR